MTWGALRLQLMAAWPDGNLDVLDAWINARYEQVLESGPWSGLRYHATVQTTAAYQSGTDTCTLTIGSASVTGAGTAWDSTRVGQRFYRPGDTALYTVAAVGGVAALTLDRPYEGNNSDLAGTVYAGSAYVFMQHIYALPADARSVIAIKDPVTGAMLGEFSQYGLDRATAIRTLVGDPKVYAAYDDSSETALPVSHQIEFYPPPLRARGFSVSYLHAALGFTGANTGGAPLPFVSTSVLLYGCRADIAAHLKDYTQARMFETKFQEELSRLLRMEYLQRRPVGTFGMADRFTRHRIARANRQWRGWRGGVPGGAE